MRKRAIWMNSAVDPVLELLDETDLALPPGVIAYNLDKRMGDAPSRSTITRAISKLESRDFIRKAPESNTYYEITEIGRAYLRGDVDTSDFADEDSDGNGDAMRG